jgi:hypothetical protein
MAFFLFEGKKMLTPEQEFQLRIMEVQIRRYSREQLIEELIIACKYTFELQNQMKGMMKSNLEKGL